ncbi:hypothetical protein KY363_01880 [Candidatus Woesearchaeota archaeon]|nr:hypothetical protein [Candidatus Woesearchaeota archaeon]
MQELKPDERRKASETVASSAIAVCHVAEALQSRFADQPEGVEAVYLRKILETYLNNIDNFLEHFVSGVPGQRGVDMMINGLEHPDSRVKPDESLIKELKRMRDSLKKENIPDLEEWKHYRRLQQKVSQLRAEAEIHRFKEELDSLLVDAMRYPETPVARTIKEYSSKKTPRIIEAEDFELAVLVWKMILSRLCLPDDGQQQRLADGLLGGRSAKDIEDEISNKLSIAAKRSKDIAELAPNIASGISSVFRSGQETGNWDNLKGLAAAASDKQKSYLFRLLYALGQDKYADYIVNLFGKEGRQLDQPKTVKTIAGVIVRLDKEKGDMQLAARDELLKMIDSMLKEMHDRLSKERDEFARLVKDRVEKLEDKHAKELKTTLEMKTELEARTRKMAYAKGILHENYVRKRKRDDARMNFNIRIVDILLLMQARTASARLMSGTPNFRKNDFDSEIEGILKSGPSAFAEHHIRNIRQIVESRISNVLTAEQFDSSMKRIDEFISKLESQIPSLIEGQRSNSSKMIEIARDSDEVLDWLDFTIRIAEEKALEDMKKIRKMGITEDKITVKGRNSLTAEDLQALNLKKAA